MRLPALVCGRLIRRYRRFLADVVLDTGEEIIAHCANPGSMMGLAAPGSRVFLSRSADPLRKLPWSWELVEVDGRLIGINTARPNALVEEAIRDGTIGDLGGYATLRREVAYGRNSRIDLMLEGPGRPPCHVEVKSVTLFREPGLAEFPDSVTSRGAKHLDELADAAERGDRAVMVYLVQAQASRFGLAADIDPGYAAAFLRARARGVEAMVWACRVSEEAIFVDSPVPFSP